MGSGTEQLASLLARHSYRRGTFTLASGKTSDFYVDVKQTVFTPDGTRLIGELILDELEKRDITLVGGMAVGAIPLVTATLAAAAGRDYPLEGFFVRKQPKDHGTAKLIDGRFHDAARVALVEDVVTTGESTAQAAAIVEEAGAAIDLIVVVVDREEDDGMKRLASTAGEVVALATKTEIVRAAG